MKTAAACVSTYRPDERAQGIWKLQQDLKENLSKFQTHTIKVQQTNSCWFSNEYPIISLQKKLNLADSYAHLPTSKPLSDYRIAIITGEGGLYSALPELANFDLILQIDCDPNPLELSACLLEELKQAESYPDKFEFFNRAFAKFRAKNPNIDGLKVSTDFSRYTQGMKGNLFSSAERFAEFKRCQDHPIQQLCLNYFSEEAMNALAQVLKNHCASVGFFNISNVCQYVMDFYQVNPFKDEETTNLTPDQYLHKLPFADNAICAYSQLFAPTSQTFTATTTIPKMADALFDIAIRPRNKLLKELTLSKGEITLFEQLCDTPKKELATLQLPTRIFQFFAKYTIAAKHEWALRLTAARLTNSEIEELKVHKEAIKSLYLQSHPTSTEPSLLIKILGKITTEPTLTESAPSAAFATN